MNSLKLQPALKLSQSLQMSPQLQLALKLLKMNNFELGELILRESYDNPFIESRNEAENNTPANLTKSTDILSDAVSLNTYEDRFNERRFIYNENQQNNNFESDFDIENTSKKEYKLSQENYSLAEYLSEQINKLNDLDLQSKIEMLILVGNLDENGFLNIDLDKLANKHNLSVEKIESAVARLQELDPPGICARDSVDSLIIQLKRCGKINSLEAKLLTTYRDKVEKHKLNEICKLENVTVETLQSAFEMIRKLDPFPGRKFNSEQTMFIKPELLTKKIENEFVTIFIDDELTDIKLSPSYLDLCKDKEQKKVKFIKDSQRSAEWLIKCIEQRKKTIHKIADFVVKFQSEFIEKGPQYLKPLGLKEVSNAVGLHESTISRAINGKLIATPRGIIELREFFSNAVSNNKNDNFNVNFEPNLESRNDSNSSDSITEVIKLMIMNENSLDPLSDEELKNLLNDRGIKIARRTVAKYREDLKIPSSPERKRIKLFSEKTGT